MPRLSDAPESNHEWDRGGEGTVRHLACRRFTTSSLMYSLEMAHPVEEREVASAQMPYRPCGKP